MIGQASALTTAVTLLLALSIYLSFQAFGQSLAWSAALLLAVGPILAGIVKITPGNLGLVESLAWLTAVAIGVQADQTVAAFTVHRVANLIFCFTLGPILARKLWKDFPTQHNSLEEPHLRNAA